jgi:exosortase A-associated hydrolase 1
MRETAHLIACAGVPMVGILHDPAQTPSRAVLMVTAGGPQYRVGGHRQLTLWARGLAAQGMAVLRFDQRGKGDTWGPFGHFTDLDDDIHAAIDHLVATYPAISEVVLWGECNAASAILYYAHRDARVTGAVLLNPWLRTRAGAAKAALKYYYVQRLMQPSFWRKLFSGRFNPFKAASSLLQLVKQASEASKTAPGDGNRLGGNRISRDLPLTEGLLQGLQRFKGELLVILSSRDPVAHEYETAVAGSPAWQQALQDCRTRTRKLATGDHTFSSAEQRQFVLDQSLAWLADVTSQSQSASHGSPQH